MFAEYLNELDVHGKSGLGVETLIETGDLRIRYNGRNVIWNIQTPDMYC